MQTTFVKFKPGFNFTTAEVVYLMAMINPIYILINTVIISYIKGTSETISRILQPYNIREAHKPTTTLRRHLLPNNRQAAVCKIKWSDYQAFYTVVRLAETLTRDWLNTMQTSHEKW